jgi:fatty-acid desaturase
MNNKTLTLNVFFKKTLTYSSLWGILLPLQAAAIYALYTLFSATAYVYWLPTLIMGYFCIMILGITMGYHRLISHKSYTTSAWIKNVLLFFGVAAGQGSPLFWTAVHRGYHHPYSDTEKDPHTPQKGFFHSWFLWLWKIDESDMNLRSVVDLARDPLQLLIHKHYTKIVWAIHGTVALISVDFWLWFLVVPSFITFHSYSITNSLTHFRVLGYRNYNTKDNSTNTWWLWPFVFGECWHNNHHGDQRAYNFGKIRWWEVDPAGFLISLIKK